MGFNTLAELEAYAEANFPDDFHDLPPLTNYVTRVHTGTNYPKLAEGTRMVQIGEAVGDVIRPVLAVMPCDMRVDSNLDETIYYRKEDEIHLFQPFDWIRTDVKGKLVVFMHYVVAAVKRARGESIEEFCFNYDPELFEAACADVAKGMRYKKQWLDELMGSRLAKLEEKSKEEDEENLVKEVEDEEGDK